MQRPQAVLAHTEATLKGASFTSQVEREHLMTQLGSIEFFQNRAMDEAQQMMQLDRFSVSRDLLAQLRQITAVTLPAGPWGVSEAASAEAVQARGEGPFTLLLTRSSCKSGVLCIGNGGPDSEAERAGLHVGSVIIAINGQVTRRVRAVVKAVQAAIRKDSKIVLTLARKTRLIVIDRTEALQMIGIDMTRAPRGTSMAPA